MKNNVKAPWSILPVIMFAFLILSPPAQAAIPEMINIQGVLTQGGAPVVGSKTVTVGFYSDPAAASQVGTNVVVNNVGFDSRGFFSLSVGVSQTALNFSAPYYVKIDVAGEAAFTQPLTAAPYAITAKNVKYSDKIGIYSGVEGASDGIVAHSSGSGVPILGVNAGSGLAAIMGVHENNGMAVYAIAKGTGPGVYAESSNGFGIFANAKRNKLIGETFVDHHGGTATSGGALRLGSGATHASVGSNLYLGDDNKAKHARQGGVAAISFSSATDATAGDIRFLAGPSKPANSDEDLQQRMVIKQGGNVGIGTAAPGAKLSVASPAKGVAMEVGRESGQPSIKAGADAAGGWLILDSNTGNLGLNYYNDKDVIIANGGGNVGIGTATPWAKLSVRSRVRIEGTSGHDPYLDIVSHTGSGRWSLTVPNDDSFRINGYVGNLSANRLFISAEGNVGIGTTTPSQKLHVAGNSYITGAVGIGTSPSPGVMLHVNGAAVIAGDVFLTGTDGGTGAFVHIREDGRLLKSVSSRRYKHDIRNFDFNIAKAGELEAKRFKWNENTATPNKEDIGLVAEDVYRVFPELVTLNSSGQPESVDYSKLSIVLLRVGQQQQSKIDSLEQRIAELEKK